MTHNNVAATCILHANSPAHLGALVILIQWRQWAIWALCVASTNACIKGTFEDTHQAMLSPAALLCQALKGLQAATDSAGAQRAARHEG